jgi:VWFA-related protein
MRSVFIIVIVAFCAVIAGSALIPAHGQVQPVQQVQQSDETLSVDVDLVNVVFTVLDRRGRFITDLRQEQFTVSEDNKPQVISNFSRETGLPLTVALLVDTSGSIRDKLRFEQEAAIEFFHSTLRRGTDKALVITFDSGVDLLQDYTDDSEVLATAVKKMRAGGGTALYDAMFLAATQKLAGQNGRRVLILISDGDDNSSRVSLTETLEAAQRNDVSIYTISTNGTTGSRSREQDRGDKVLKRFSDETGGRMFTPFKLQELTEDFLNIGDELRAQYTLAYRPSNARRDGTFRRIRIQASDKRYDVRARQGYYAPRPSRGK